MEGKLPDLNTNIRSAPDKTRSTEGGDILSTTSKHRPPSPAPYAFHEVEGEKATKGQSHGKATPPVSNSQSSNVRAPYAQPVLDASKLHAAKRITPVDERIASVRERRLQQQQVHDESVTARHAKEEASRNKWQQVQDEKRKKVEEHREKEALRRKEVEERKSRQDMEDKKRAEAIVARTEQQANVVLRQKRAGSADRTKRWSWGAGGMGGGGGFMPSASTATLVDTAPSPFHYFDPTRLTKRTASTDKQRRRPLSMNFSQFDVSSVPDGDDGGNASSSPAAGAVFGTNKGFAADDKFSKSPLVMNTTHMKFASGLRSYDSTPPSAMRKSVSPATTPRSRRARSTDTRTKIRNDANDTIFKETLATKPFARGRSTEVRKSPSSKEKGSANTSPQQLTEPSAVSSRLLAPTRASIARSINRDLDELSTTSSNASVPLRSRSSDRKRPSSARSDSSSASSTVSSTRARNSPRSSKPSTTRGTSPSSSSRPKQRPPSPAVRSTTPTNEKRGESPKPRSPVIKEAPKLPKRGPSPARTKSSPTANKKTPSRDVSSTAKPSPPQIKQSLTPTSAVSRPKHTPTSTSTNTLSKKVHKKMQQPNKPASKTSEISRKPNKTVEKESISGTPSSNPMDQSYLVISSPTDASQVPHERQNQNEDTKAQLDDAQEVVQETVEKHEDRPNAVETTEIKTETKNFDIQMEEPSINELSLADEIQKSSHHEVGSNWEANISDEKDLLPAPTATPPLQSDEVTETAAQLSDDVIVTAQTELQKEITTEKDLNDALTESNLNAEVTEVPSNDVEKNTDIESKEMSSENGKQESAVLEEVNIPHQPNDDAHAQPEIDSEPAVSNQLSNDAEESASTLSNSAAAADDHKKKEKKVSPEEQAYKDAIAAKRKEMKEKREREEKEKQERLRIEAEQQAQREEDARRMAEEARLEHERMMEEERLKKEELEKKKKKEAEELAKKHEEFRKEQREKAEQRAREEAEKVRRDKELVKQKQEEERLARKKRLEMIMRRTRGGDSPTSNASATTGEQSPVNTTPVRGNSPTTLSAPDRVNSSVVTTEPKEIVNNSPSTLMSEPKDSIIQPVPEANIETISLENSNSQSQYNGGDHPTPIVAFTDPLSANEKLFPGSTFTPVSVATTQNNLYNTLNGSNQEKAENQFDIQSESLFNNTNVTATAVVSDDNVPTGTF